MRGGNSPRASVSFLSRLGAIVVASRRLSWTQKTCFRLLMKCLCLERNVLTAMLADGALAYLLRHTTGGRNFYSNPFPARLPFVQMSSHSYQSAAIATICNNSRYDRTMFAIRPISSPYFRVYHLLGTRAQIQRKTNLRHAQTSFERCFKERAHSAFPFLPCPARRLRVSRLIENFMVKAKSILVNDIVR